MKTFRLALAGIGAAFVSVVCFPPLVGATSMAPPVRQLSFKDRVTYQWAIEEVYWRHRIWPTGSANCKPSLDAMVSQAAIEQKVHDYLRDSELLETKWQMPLMAELLQTEMDRMAQQTRQPEVLRELFAALGNDPFVIAECLARPVLSERLVTSLSVQHQESPESGAVTAQEPMGKINAPATTNYRLPTVSGDPSECLDHWTSTSTINAPSARTVHAAVWTGTEMIVWGGTPQPNSGGRYNPSTDSWTAVTKTNAPVGREYPAAVWTGSEMIVWGGEYIGTYYNTGGRYNPVTDTWTATTTTNAPLARTQHKAVWTGAEMIVWGGYIPGNAFLDTGGRYNPATDSWTATSTVNAPAGRYGHTAVWTDSEMIVWGGIELRLLGTGGRYNPSTDSWTATTMTNAPIGRYAQTGVWTGSEMIVWGGEDANFMQLNTGGKYNPITNTWTITSTTNPPSGRASHTAVWAGNEMIIWGGYDDSNTNTGARYNPSTDSWTATSTTNAPAGRTNHSAVWTGSEMIVWGGTGVGQLNTGGVYCAPLEPIALEARVRRQGAKHVVVLTWSPADGGSVNVLRDGVVIRPTDDDGDAQDKLGTHTGIFTYQVCETDAGDCSNPVEVRVKATED